MGKIRLPFIDSDLFKVGLTVYIKLAVQLNKYMYHLHTPKNMSYVLCLFIDSIYEKR
jgi:hypothetical protein